MAKGKSGPSECRMALLRKLIELAYTHTDRETFYRKFRECVHVASLRSAGILDDRTHVRTVGAEKRLSDAEIEMYCLMELGFTPQEMAVVCGDKSLNSIYIMRHRLKKKLEGAAAPEAVRMLLVLCLIAGCLMWLFDAMTIL